MSENNWCRIVEANNRKVLVYKDFCHDDNMFQNITLIDSPDLNALINISPKYKDRDKRDRQFNEFDEKKAEALIRSVEKIESTNNEPKPTERE